MDSFIQHVQENIKIITLRSGQRVISYCTRAITVLILLTFVLSSGLAQVSALSPEQTETLQDIQENVPFVNAGRCSPTGTAASSAPVTPGSGSPDGSTFPALDPTAMANAINAYIAKQYPSSELAGLGATIVAGAKNSNVSPFIIVAIAEKESSMASPTDQNVQNAGNSFGRSTNGPKSGQPTWVGPTGRNWYKWTSVEASVDNTAPENQNAVGGGDIAAYIRNQYATAIDTDNLLSFFQVYNPPSDGGDPPAYASLVQSIVNTVAGLSGGATTSTAASTTSSTTDNTASSCACAAGTGGTPGAGSKTIVLDPGHATTSNIQVDPATNEPVFDYSNPVEQQQVWDLAQDLQTKLQAAGYTVLLTKNSENDTSTNLEQRAQVGNNANAALGVSIHTTPGSPSVGNDIFVPVPGEYLVKTTGQHDVYTNAPLAATDQKDGATMVSDLNQATGLTYKEGGYDQIYGPITRTDPNQAGLVMQGTMLVTQYFATVPWLYAEQYQDAGSGSTSAAALQKYEAGLLKGIEDIVPSSGSTTSTSASSASSNCGSSSSSCSTNGASTTGPNAAILCEAEKYQGIYYKSGGGHGTYSTFRQQCPETAISSAAATSQPKSQGPCATDCSGLVTVALDGAYNQNFEWLVSNSNGQMVGSGSQYWQSIPINQAQAGDIVTTHVPDGHVEIVDHVQGNTIYTFGSHSDGKQTSSISTPLSYWDDGAWRWTGPGSATQ